MLESKPPRNNQPETHPDDERGRRPCWFAPPSRVASIVSLSSHKMGMLPAINRVRSSFSA